MAATVGFWAPLTRLANDTAGRGDSTSTTRRTHSFQSKTEKPRVKSKQRGIGSSSPLEELRRQEELGLDKHTRPRTPFWESLASSLFIASVFLAPVAFMMRRGLRPHGSGISKQGAHAVKSSPSSSDKGAGAAKNRRGSSKRGADAVKNIRSLCNMDADAAKVRRGSSKQGADTVRDSHERQKTKGFAGGTQNISHISMQYVHDHDVA